MNVTPEIP